MERYLKTLTPLFVTFFLLTLGALTCPLNPFTG